MKEEYKWNYTIKIKTKDNEYVYEKETLDNIDLLLMKHPSYEEVRALRNKPKCDKCNIELNEVFIQQLQDRTYRLCRKCNEKFIKYNENAKRLQLKKKR